MIALGILHKDSSQEQHCGVKFLSLFLFFCFLISYNAINNFLNLTNRTSGKNCVIGESYNIVNEKQMTSLKYLFG